MNVSITLPWPDPTLSPNARVHRMQRAACVKHSREAARLLMLSKIGGCIPVFVGPLTLEAFIHPPDKKHRDLDNTFASLKPSIDGICQALGVDDSRIATVTLLRGATIRGGEIVIDLFDTM